MGDPGYLFRIIKYSYSNKFNIFEAKYFQTKKQCVMYHLLHTHTHTAKAVLAVFCLMVISITSTAQTIQIDSTYSASCELFPFGSSGTIYGLSINGTVNLNSDTSLIRIVLIDNFFNELMVYEAYQYISPDSPFEITNECDETCYSNGFVPYSVQIQVTDANIEIVSLDMRSLYWYRMGWHCSSKPNKLWNCKK